MAQASPLVWFDGAQQQRPWLGIPIATAKKFAEDKSTNMASMIAFWAFFSLFPLLLAFITLLGYFVPAGTKTSVLKQVAGDFPLLDPSTVSSLSGSWWALVVGLVSALWSGSAVVRTVQYAFNSVWEVPQRDRPKLLEKVVRSIAALGTIGLGLVVSVLITGLVTGTTTAFHIGVAGRIGGYAVAIALDVGLFVVAFRMLTDRDISTRDVLPGAVFSGVTFWVLQGVSSLIISHYLNKAQATYGHFATVITILWWFYLEAILTLLGAQANVVVKRHYYPRGLVDPPSTEADRRVYEAYADEQTYLDEQDVDAGVGENGRDTTRMRHRSSGR